MSAIWTVQMYAVGTGQMSSAESAQMSTGHTGRCPVALFYICLVLAEDICLVSTADIRFCPVSTADIFPVSKDDNRLFLNITLFTCQKAMDLDKHIVTFQTDHTPPTQNRGGVLMGIAVWRVAENPNKIKWHWRQYVRKWTRPQIGESPWKWIQNGRQG